jgi:pimeloyl-ACP methyl ester carboxylesterase
VLAEGLDGTTTRVEEVHQAVARRSFAAVGPVRRLPEAVHDRLAARLYAIVRTIGPAAIRSGALGLGSVVDAEADRLDRSSRGKAFVAAFNGVFGDSLARRRNGFALTMALRADGRVIRTDGPSLAAAFPSAGSRIAVFVHGFGETDDSWRWFSQAHWGVAGLSYGELLRRDRGYTPLFVHYNSGRELADNGAELSALLDEVAANWPVALEETVLVAHSVGGLVARAAVLDGHEAGAAWVGTARSLVTIGAPRSATGAERAASATRRVLARLPETRPLARLLDARSAGLKDLRDRIDEPLPRGIREHRLPRDGARINHFKLLNHPAVYEQLKAVVTARSGPDRARAARGARYERAAKAVRARRPSRRR